MKPEVFVSFVGVMNDGCFRYPQLNSPLYHHSIGDTCFQTPVVETMGDCVGVVLTIDVFSTGERNVSAMGTPISLGIFVAIKGCQRYRIRFDDVGAPKGETGNRIIHHEFEGFFPGKERGEVAMDSLVGFRWLSVAIIPCQRGYNGIGIGFLLTADEVLQRVWLE